MRRFILIFGFLLFVINNVMAQCASCKSVTQVQTVDFEKGNNVTRILIWIMPYIGAVSVLALIFLIIYRINKLKNDGKN